MATRMQLDQQAAMEGPKMLGDAMQKLGDQIQDRRDKTKALRQVVKAYAPEGDAGDMVSDWADSAGLGELQGYVQGKQAISAQQEAQARIQETLQRGQYYTDVGAARQQAAQDANTDASALSNYASTLDQTVNNPDPNDPAQVQFAAGIPQAVKLQLHAAAATGKTNPRTAAVMFKNIQSYFQPQGGPADNTPPVQTMIGAVPYVWKPGSKEFQPRADYGLDQRQQNALELVNAKTKPDREPGTGPQMSNDGKFYWDVDRQAWKPYLAKEDLVDALTKLHPELAAPAGKSMPTNAAPANAAPAPGLVSKGYKFLGGDPANQANWQKQ